MKFSVTRNLIQSWIYNCRRPYERKTHKERERKGSLNEGANEFFIGNLVTFFFFGLEVRKDLSADLNDR